MSNEILNWKPADISAIVRQIGHSIIDGGFGEIRRGRIDDGTPGGLCVAFKFLKSRSADIRGLKRFRRETYIWNFASPHEHILQFLGTADVRGMPVALVSPWVDNGNCNDYLRQHPQKHRLPIILGIVRGLEHLHRLSVIHGDLKGANILISNSGTPLICDFGLAVVVKDLENLSISKSLLQQGSLRWRAAELVFGDDNANILVSEEGDMWAFGMVILELMTGQNPYYNLRNHYAIGVDLHNRKHPEWPPCDSDVYLKEMTGSLRNFIYQCWSWDPVERPTASQALTTIKELAIGRRS